MALPPPGWRRAALYWGLAAFVSFVINLAVLLYAVVAKHANVKSGVVQLGAGDCSRMRNLDTGIHVVINALSTVLLAGSNYCMQCASAPTRTQIDAAHRRKRWLDVGIPSLRNLRSVGWASVVPWALLALSSLPLHLLYNSVVFSGLTANVYSVWSLNEGILNTANLNATLAADGSSAETYADNPGLQQTISDYHAGLFANLSVAACIDAYAQPFQSSWGDLILMSSNDTHNSWLGNAGGGGSVDLNACGAKPSYQWICGQYLGGHELTDISSCETPCDELLPEIRSNTTNWQPFGLVVEYCLARQTTGSCGLYFSTTISIVVLVLNLCKVAVMLWVAFGRRSPLLTVGDAVASFLRTPDEATAGMCLAGKKEFESGGGGAKWAPKALEFQDKRGRRGEAVSLFRWIACILAYIAGLSVCIYYLTYGLSQLLGQKTLSAAASLGIGTASEQTLLIDPIEGGWSARDPTMSRALLRNVLLANTPQLVFSLLYFTYNALLTATCTAAEWSSYALHHRRGGGEGKGKGEGKGEEEEGKGKGLRVSAAAPVGAQRGTYFLQLPFRYGAPLMVVSGTLHWLVSQSLFLVYVQGVNAEGSVVVTSDFVTCGWSPLGVLCTIVLGAAMVVFLVGWSLRRLPSGMPVVGSCSAAIAAACHGMPWEDGAWERPLSWGATKVADSEKSHCSFSSGEVQYPRKGEMYE